VEFLKFLENMLPTVNKVNNDFFDTITIIKIN